jgi:uncharacterized membrane protein required for colicin V production
MNPLDAIALLLLLIGLVAGARAGFLGPVLGLVGAVAGFGLALLGASMLRETLLGIEQPMRSLVTIVGLGAFVVAGEAIGAAIGERLSRGMHGAGLRPLDAAGGALVGAGHVVLIVWLVGGLLAGGLSPSLGPAARESVAIRLATERLPAPETVAGHILELLDTTELPQLFAGVEPPPAAPVDLPADAEAAALAESALASTARVTSSGCGPGLSVGSGFFVSAAHLITNAHVVAGGEAVTVSVDGSTMDATVVAFDDEADLALLHVPGAGAPALTLASEVPTRGTPGVALGYPGGGDLTVTAAGVTASHEVAGPDIYGSGSFARTIVELRAEIRRGNSGGPLLIRPGVVGGVIFGASRLNPDVGYAIGSDEALERLGPAIGDTQAIDTGACL